MDDYVKNGYKKNETYNRLDCYHNWPCMAVKLVLTLLYLIKIPEQLININEVTDFHGGFLIFSALRSNTRWTTVLYRAHDMRKKYLTIPSDF